MNSNSNADIQEYIGTIDLDESNGFELWFKGSFQLEKSCRTLKSEEDFEGKGIETGYIIRPDNICYDCKWLSFNYQKFAIDFVPHPLKKKALVVRARLVNPDVEDLYDLTGRITQLTVDHGKYGRITTLYFGSCYRLSFNAGSLWMLCFEWWKPNTYIQHLLSLSDWQQPYQVVDWSDTFTQGASEETDWSFSVWMVALHRTKRILNVDASLAFKAKEITKLKRIW